LPYFLQQAGNNEDAFVMLSVVDDFPEYQFVIAAPSQEYSFYQKFISNGNIKFIKLMIY
jgi:lipid-A-disaccharide synthase